MMPGRCFLISTGACQGLRQGCCEVVQALAVQLGSRRVSKYGMSKVVYVLQVENWNGWI